MSMYCETCGEFHDDLPLDIGFEKPGAYFHMRKQSKHWNITPEASTFKNARFFIRGYVKLPIKGIPDPFIWGLWAEVPRDVFDRYLAFDEIDGSYEPRYFGKLSVEHDSRYNGMDQLLVSIQLGAARERPRFYLRPCNHWLFRSQENGISLHFIHQMMHAIFPDDF